MKYFAVVLAYVGSAFALPVVSSQIQTPQPVTEDIVIDIVEDWTLPSKALGLDIIETSGGPFVVGIDNGSDRLNLWENGLIVDYITLPPSSEGHSWGVACKNVGDTATEILVSDFNLYDFHQSADVGISWSLTSDPGGKYSRGIDFDGSHYWTVINGYTDELCRFQPGGSSETWEIPEIGGNQ